MLIKSVHDPTTPKQGPWTDTSVYERQSIQAMACHLSNDNTACEQVIICSSVLVRYEMGDQRILTHKNKESSDRWKTPHAVSSKRQCLQEVNDQVTSDYFFHKPSGEL